MVAHFERLENNGKNPWKIVAEKTSISKKFLISGTADFVNISSEEQFTEFLKDNKEDFYELLEKKTFIDYTFEEILNLSYRSDENLIVPHPDMKNRDFVLKPLMQIAPYKLHPVYRKTISDMYAELMTKK